MSKARDTANLIHTAGILSQDEAVSGSWTINGSWIVSNTLNFATATSPNTHTIQFGDNTGWVLRFMTNVSGTPTTRFSFKDNGDFTAVGNVTANSDARLKTNIQTIEDPLSLINELRGVRYVKDGNLNIGVIAQEVQQVLPEVVHEDENGMLSVAYGNIVGLLIEAIKELKREIDELKGK